jgi:predicted nuclease with TOPRIM domain
MEELRGLTEGFERLEEAMVRLAEAQAGTEARVNRLEDAMASLAEGQRRLEEAVAPLVAAQARAEARVGRLEDAMAALTTAQARTEARIGRLEDAMAALTTAQARTEAQIGRLEDTMAALAEGQRQLATAQARTEAALQRLARQVGGLSDTVGGDIEDIAYIVLHDVLQREFGWEVGVLERTWQQWNGEPEEINIFGQATDLAQPQRTIWIVGEAKHNLTLREVEQFAQQVERGRRHLVGEVYAVCFSYRARPEVRARLKELGIPLLFSYGRFA